jgi:hypothetical protein
MSTKMKKEADDTTAEGEDSAVARLRSKVADKSEADEGDKPKPDDSGDVEVKLEDGDDDDGDDDDEPRQSRKERRSARYRENEERARAAEERSIRMEAEMAALRNQFAASQQRQAAPAAPQRTELDDVMEQQQSVQREYQALHASGKLTQADAERLNKQWLELGDKRVLALMPKPRPQEDPLMSHMRAKHIDVMSNPVAKMFAQGEYTRRVAMAGGRISQADHVKVFEEAMDAARRQYKIGKPAPSPATSDTAKAKYEAPPRGGSGSGSGPRTMTLSKEERKMANAKYAHIPDETKRYQMWAKTVGTRLQKKAS